MNAQSVKIYRCKQCDTVVRRAEARREHCFWHHITDKNVDLYFTEEEEPVAVSTTVDVATVPDTPRVAGTSYGVLAVSAALIAAMMLLYVITK